MKVNKVTMKVGHHYHHGRKLAACGPWEYTSIPPPQTHFFLHFKKGRQILSKGFYELCLVNTLRNYFDWFHVKYRTNIQLWFHASMQYRYNPVNFKMPIFKHRQHGRYLHGYNKKNMFLQYGLWVVAKVQCCPSVVWRWTARYRQQYLYTWQNSLQRFMWKGQICPYDHAPRHEGV
jgi:hypothetical protein